MVSVTTACMVALSEPIQWLGSHNAAAAAASRRQQYQSCRLGSRSGTDAPPLPSCGRKLNTHALRPRGVRPLSREGRRRTGSQRLRITIPRKGAYTGPSPNFSCIIIIY